jgi:hypothetical protein
MGLAVGSVGGDETDGQNDRKEQPAEDNFQHGNPHIFWLSRNRLDIG